MWVLRIELRSSSKYFIDQDISPVSDNYLFFWDIGSKRRECSRKKSKWCNHWVNARKRCPLPCISVLIYIYIHIYIPKQNLYVAQLQTVCPACSLGMVAHSYNSGLWDLVWKQKQFIKRIKNSENLTTSLLEEVHSWSQIGPSIASKSS